MSFDFLAWWASFSEAPFVLLIVLLVMTHLVYLRYFRHARLTVLSPSLIMALGVFAMVCMPELHVNITLMLIAAEELLLIWTYISIALLYGLTHGYINLSRPMQKLEVGTWVAATTLTMLVIDQIEPTLYGFILILVLASLCLYAIFFYLAVQWFAVWRRKKLHLDGRVMLMSIATLSIALLIMEVFGSVVPTKIYQSIILLGVLLGVVGVGMIINAYTHRCHHHFFCAWPVTNCLIYAAFAMMGLCALETHSFSSRWIFIGWCMTIVCFIVVELLEILRLLFKLRVQGMWKALTHYHVQQWLRIFSLAMLHGFALSYYNHHYASDELVAFAANYLQYVVASLVVIELGLMVLRVEKHGEFR